MRLSSFGCLVYIVFLGVAFVVALSQIYHYRQQSVAPRISQRKKLHLQKITLIWVCIAIIAASVGLIGACFCYLVEPPEKQYVLISNSDVDLAAGEPVRFSVDIENGPGEVTVGLHSVTSKLRGRSNEKILSYGPDRPDSHWSPARKLMAHQKIHAQWQFNKLVLTQEQINDLNSKMPDGQLFIFARAEWIDEAGIRHPLPFCYQYTQNFPNNLAVCDDDIKFR